MTSKRQIQEKQLKSIMGKDIGGKNPIFSPSHIAQIYKVFILYADPRQRRSDIRDILLSASTLGLDSRNELVYRLLQQIQNSAEGHALDFQGFLKELTAKIGNPFTEEGRKAHFNLLDVESKGELQIHDMKYINEQLKYGYDEDHLWGIIHAVGGYNADTITYDKFNQYIHRKITSRKAQM